MPGLSKFLYRFRGLILGAFAIALFASPAAPFPWDTRNTDAGYANALAFCDISALAMFFFSAILRIKSRQHIGDHTRGSTHQADALVTWGPYALVRHPLYLSNLGIAVAIILLHLGPTSMLVPFLVAITLFESALSHIEDQFLHEKFGTEWEKWAKDVEAFNIGPRVFFRKGLKRLKDDYRSKKPVRTVWQSFYADRSTWAWLMFCNLLLILKKTYFT